MKVLLIDLWKVLLKIVDLLLERFFYPVLVIVFLIITVIWVNWHSLLFFFSKLNYDQLTLLKDYISVITSLPIVILIISLLFIYKFSYSIETLLENSRLSGIFGVSVDKKEAQSQTDKDTKEVTPSTKIEEKAKSFLLNSTIAPLSKTALQWIYVQPSHLISKTDFLSRYQLPYNIINQELEKLAELDILLKYELLKEKDGFISVTDDGKKFLKENGLNYDIGVS